MKMYSVHVINDGKWQVVIYIRESTEFKYKPESQPELRALIDANYEASPDEMARLVLNSVLDCEAVDINLLCGPCLRLEK